MNTRTSITMIVATLGMGVMGGCGTTPPRNQAAVQSGGGDGGVGGMGMMDEMCPMAVPGTTVAASDVDGGVALAFTTRSGDVEELRRRVRRMAEMHAGHGGMGMMPAATATVEDVDGGARIALIATDPAQQEALRQHAHMHAGQMQGGQCPMMQERAAPSPAMPPRHDHGDHHPGKD